MNIYSSLATQNILPSANAGANEGKTAADIASEKAEKEKTDFLQLLLTQLSNQNPLDPMDTDEWTAQLTRYSILEQGIETNEQLSVTNDLLNTNATAANFSYIGKEVEVESNIGAVQDGSAKWSYLVDGAASDVKLSITDASGTILEELDGSIATGVQSLTFDAEEYGLTDGQQLYLSVNATDNEGNKLKSRVATQLEVDGVWTDGNQSYLTAGEISFKTDDVRKLIEKEQTNTPQQQTSTAEADIAQ